MRGFGFFVGKPDVVEIVPGLYIGSAPHRRATAALVKAGVTQVVDLRREARGSTSRWPEGVAIWPCALSEYEAPTKEALRDIGRQVGALLNSGAIIFVHCREGIQRAPMVACAVLLETGWSLSDAYRLVRARRPGAALSEAQLRVLRELEPDWDSVLAVNTEDIARQQVLSPEQ